jgi:hypothetical protein
MNAHCNLSISFRIHGDTATTMETCIGIIERVVFVRVTRPALDMSYTFHGGMQSTVELASDWRSDLRNL